MMGYVTSVVQQQMSNRNNLYFDVDVKTNPSERKRIQIMENSQSKTRGFLLN